MKAKSIKGKSPAAIATHLQESMADGFKPTLAVAFISIKQDFEAINKLLDAQGIVVFGATTAGEFIDGDLGDGSAVVLLMDMNPAYFRLECMHTGERTTRDIAQDIARIGQDAFAKPVFVVASGGLSTDGETIVEGLDDVLGADGAIFGGLAGDDFTMKATYVFSNQFSSDNGLVALILDGEHVQVSGLATSGWKPVGTVRTITRSEGNVIYTIDDEPALDVIIKYTGTPKELLGSNEIISVASEFPMQLLRDDAPSVLRAPLFANKEDRSIVCAGSLPQGSKIRFSLPPDFDIIDQVVADCRQIKETQPEADALIMFSCFARHMSLGPLVSEEIDHVKNVWNSPLVGFFCYGEIGKALTSHHDFHNNTCSLVVLKEVTQ